MVVLDSKNQLLILSKHSTGKPARFYSLYTMVTKLTNWKYSKLYPKVKPSFT